MPNMNITIFAEARQSKWRGTIQTEEANIAINGLALEKSYPEQYIADLAVLVRAIKVAKFLELLRGNVMLQSHSIDTLWCLHAKCNALANLARPHEGWAPSTVLYEHNIHISSFITQIQNAVRSTGSTLYVSLAAAPAAKIKRACA